MALEYTLYLATRSNSETILQNVSNRFSLNQVLDNLKGSGVLISVDMVHPRTQEIYEEEAGIAPTVSLLFTLDKSEPIGMGKKIMIRICANLLEREGGDAVLVQHGDALLFLCKSNKLILNMDTDWWADEMLALLPMQWQKGKMPII